MDFKIKPSVIKVNNWNFCNNRNINRFAQQSIKDFFNENVFCLEISSRLDINLFTDMEGSIELAHAFDLVRLLDEAIKEYGEDDGYEPELAQTLKAARQLIYKGRKIIREIRKKEKKELMKDSEIETKARG